MLHVWFNNYAPHAAVHLAGTLTTADMVDAQDDLERGLMRIRRGGCLFADARGVEGLEVAALGTLLYFVSQVRAARPSLIIYLARPNPASPTLRRQILRVLSKSLVFCTTPKEAARAHREAYPDAPPLHVEPPTQ